MRIRLRVSLYSLAIMGSCFAIPVRRKAIAPARAPMSSHEPIQAAPQTVGYQQTVSPRYHRINGIVSSSTHAADASKEKTGGTQSPDAKANDNEVGEGHLSAQVLPMHAPSAGDTRVYEAHRKAYLDLNQPPTIASASPSSVSHYIDAPIVVNNQEASSSIRLSKSLQDKIRKSKFLAEWDKLKIDYKNPPEAERLAELVLNMNIEGFRRQSIGTFASYLIREKFPQSYADGYFRKIKAVTETAKWQRRLAKERAGEVKRKKPEKITSNTDNQEGMPESKRRRTRVKKPDIRDERNERDKKRVIDAIDANGWWSLPIEDLEKKTRGFKMQGASIRYCTWAIRKHLKDINRGTDAVRLSKLRIIHNTRIRHETEKMLELAHRQKRL